MCLPRSPFTYREWRPVHLAGLVELVWYYQGPSSHPRKRIFPNGRVEVLVNLGQPYRTLVGTGVRWLKTGCLSGLHAGPMVIEQPARQDVLGVRLHPAGARALIASPMREVTDTHLDLADLFGRSADELVERCQEVTSLEERVRLAASWVESRVRGARPADPAIGWCAARIEGTAGSVPIAELRAQTGLSKTRLLAGFRDHVGVAPKLFARIVRFRRVLKTLQSGTQPLAQVALDAGYYDQPHMNAEFGELAGITPMQFLAHRHPVGDGTTAADLG